MDDSLVGTRVVGPADHAGIQCVSSDREHGIKEIFINDVFVQLIEYL